MIAAVRAASRHRLQLFTCLLILIVASAIGVGIYRPRPLYAESATVLFIAPSRYSSATVYTWYAQSLISTGSVIGQIMASPLTQGQIRAAGGIGSYDFALTNLYNQDYPDYGYPEAMLTGRAPTPAQTRQTYLAASDALIRILAGRQPQAGDLTGDRTGARITGD